MKNILTFDIEEYFQVENFKGAISHEEWEQYESRIEIGIDVILQLLAEYGAKATFFILGWNAERYPELVRRISKAGHEIGTHGYRHELIYKQTPTEFRRDLVKSLDILKHITGHKVESYRAPSFSLTQQSLWALDILLECGVKYDSSVFPIVHSRYGIPEAERFPYDILKRKDKVLKEFPIATFEMFGKRFPFSGGGYFRLLPSALIKGIIKKINQEGQPVMMYFHPWEFDPAQPKVKATVLNRFRHYLNIHKTEDKMRACLDAFDFGCMRDFFETPKSAAQPAKKKPLVVGKALELSIVIPVYNEEECVGELFKRVHTEVATLGKRYEIIMIDDGSVDKTPTLLQAMQAEHKELRVIRFRKNYGQTPAMVAGFDYARGDIIVTMDGDLQNDPADIPKLLAKMDEGYEVVSGWRYKRQDKLLTRKIPSMVANKLISMLTGVRLHDYGCSLKAYKAECIRPVNAYGEMHRFFPAVASITGARTAEIPVNHYARTMGKSKYGLSRTFKVFADLFTIFMITKFSSKPSIFFGLCSLPFVMLSFVFFGFSIIGYSTQGEAYVVIPGAAMLSLILASHFILLALLSVIILRKGEYRASKLSTITAEVIN